MSGTVPAAITTSYEDKGLHSAIFRRGNTPDAVGDVCVASFRLETHNPKAEFVEKLNPCAPPHHGMLVAYVRNELSFDASLLSPRQTKCLFVPESNKALATDASPAIMVVKLAVQSAVLIALGKICAQNDGADSAVRSAAVNARLNPTANDSTAVPELSQIIWNRSTDATAYHETPPDTSPVAAIVPVIVVPVAVQPVPGM